MPRNVIVNMLIMKIGAMKAVPAEVPLPAWPQPCITIKRQNGENSADAELRIGKKIACELQARRKRKIHCATR